MATGSSVINPVVDLMTDVIEVINNHDNPLTLQMQFELTAMESLVQFVATFFFRDQQKAPPEFVMFWLQLLQNSFAQLKRLLNRRLGRCQRCLDCVVCKPRRFSKEVTYWNSFFNHLYHGFQGDLSIFFTSLHFPSTKPLYREDAIDSGFAGSGIGDVQPLSADDGWMLFRRVAFKEKNVSMQIELRAMESLVQDVGMLFFQGQHKAPPVFVMIWLQWLQNSVAQLKRLLNRRLGRWQRCLDCVVCKPRTFSKEVTYWNSFFNHLYHGFQGELSILVTSLHFLSTKPLYREDAIDSGFVGSGIGDVQPLSADDGWMLFRRVAFKEEHVSMDIQECGRSIAAECKGIPLAINVVAAAMVGQRSVDEWVNCLSSIRSVDTSTFAATHPHLDAQLYRLFRWSYDALPNSNLKNCFLYSAMFHRDLQNGNPLLYGSRAEGVDSRELVEMWIGEGLVKSEEGTHIMEMAIGRNYIKLLLHRCFFHIVKQSTNVIRRSSVSVHDVFPSIRVPDVIREMAMHVAQKEGNFLVMRSPDLQNLREDEYENCRRISFADINSIGDLPTNLRCPKLASLILAGKTRLQTLPSEFLLFLPSLTVLNLSGCNQITSIPTSVGQLRQLEFLSLSGVGIRHLPEEICHLPKLQFLNLSLCTSLESLPSQIGELKNLNHLDLWECYSLKMIPREISELTSLCRLRIWTNLSVEMEAPASIWSLKGLKNLTELAVYIVGRSGIKDGIMATWSEMRHLNLAYWNNASEEDLPQDVQNMKKLQSFMLWRYAGLNLPNCKFEHLEMVRLHDCGNIRELTPLERLPNLKILKLYDCSELRELGIGSGGSVAGTGGYPRLQKLVLHKLYNLESLCGASKRGVWDERTLPHLRVLKISECPSLKRLPTGMEKLQNLCALICEKEWWDSIIWEDDNMRVKVESICKHAYY